MTLAIEAARRGPPYRTGPRAASGDPVPVDAVERRRGSALAVGVIPGRAPSPGLPGRPERRGGHGARTAPTQPGGERR